MIQSDQSLVDTMRLLKTIPRFERWQNRPLDPAINHWLQDANEQQLLSLAADVLSRLSTPDDDTV